MDKPSCFTCVKWLTMVNSKPDLGGFCLHGIRSKDETFERVLPLTPPNYHCENYKSPDES